MTKLSEAFAQAKTAVDIKKHNLSENIMEPCRHLLLGLIKERWQQEHLCSLKTSNLQYIKAIKSQHWERAASECHQRGIVGKDRGMGRTEGVYWGVGMGACHSSPSKNHFTRDVNIIAERTFSPLYTSELSLCITNLFLSHVFI